MGLSFLLAGQKLAKAPVAISSDWLEEAGKIRARSSAGRAPHWQCGGRRFDPDRVHFKKPRWTNVLLRLFFVLPLLSCCWRDQLVSALFIKDDRVRNNHTQRDSASMN